jgi:mRNA interferase MazF
MTPNTIGFDFGDVVLVPFPFTDQSGAKRRPAIVVSSAAYHRARADVVVMAVTGRAAQASSNPGEIVIIDWKRAGLIKSSVAKPVVATLERHLVLERLGALQQGDRDPVRRALGWIFGFAG